MIQAVACALLALIGGDLVGDASCDLPPVLSTGTGGVLQGAGSGASTEPCASFCVPDCFCCSRTVAAGPAVVPPPPVPLDLVEPSTLERSPEGVRPVVDHPPLLRG